MVLGKTEEQKEYLMAWNAWKRCCKKVDSQGEHFTSIHDRFLRDPVYRESQLSIGWTEQQYKEMDEPAKENHTYHLSTEEFKKIPRTMVSHLEQVRQNGPVRLRPDFRAALSLSLSKTVSTESQANKLQNPFLHNNVGDASFLKRFLVGQV